MFWNILPLQKYQRFSRHGSVKILNTDKKEMLSAMEI